jgi:hypothetical protein
MALEQNIMTGINRYNVFFYFFYSQRSEMTGKLLGFAISS